jgi:hypothetical protein
LPRNVSVAVNLDSALSASITIAAVAVPLDLHDRVSESGLLAARNGDRHLSGA